MGDLKEEEDNNNNDEIHTLQCNTIENAKAIEDEWEIWLADTSASCHVTNNSIRMTNRTNAEGDRVVVGDKRKSKVEMKGDLNLLTKTLKDHVALKNIRVVKEIGKNIISIGKLLCDGGELSGSDNVIKINIHEVTLTFTKNVEDGLYYTKLRRMTSSKKDHCIEITMDDDNKKTPWTKVESQEKKKWRVMTREEAHSRWGHPHLNQMNTMGNFFKIRLTGKLPSCAGCNVIKGRAMKTTKTCRKSAINNGERLFIDTTGPYPKSRGGMKYWMVAVDDKSDKTWTYYSNTKKNMIKFVKEIVTTINGLELKVKYIRCDNAGEHQQALQQFCKEKGIIMEYTAPNTPKQNARAEKKIQIWWQRAMTMMVHANLTLES